MSSVQFLFLTSSSSSAGVRVSPGELCVPLVQVRRKKVFYGFKFKEKTCKSCNKLPPLVLRDITDDEACVDEVRMTFRFFASVLVRRAQKVRHIYDKDETHFNCFHH